MIASTLPDLREALVTVVSRCVRQAEVVADRKGISPQIPPRRAVGGETGALGEARHEVDRFLDARLHVDRNLPCSPAHVMPRPTATTSDQQLTLLVSGKAVLTCPAETDPA